MTTMGSEGGWESADGRSVLHADELSVLQAVLDGRRQRVPNGFWHDEDGYRRGLAWLRYVIEVGEARGTREDVRARIADATLTETHLAAWADRHHLTTYAAFAAAFPDYGFLPWEADRVPRGYWAQHGDAARAAALRWWLEQEGLTVAEAVKRVSDWQLDVKMSLDKVGLGTLIATQDVWSLMRLLDPELPPDRPNKVAARRSRRTLRCPWCDASAQSLILHAVAAHGRGAADLRAVLGPDAVLETAELRQRRQQHGHRWLQRGPKKRGDTHDDC